MNLFELHNHFILLIANFHVLSYHFLFIFIKVLRSAFLPSLWIILSFPVHQIHHLHSFNHYYLSFKNFQEVEKYHFILFLFSLDYYFMKLIFFYPIPFFTCDKALYLYFYYIIFSSKFLLQLIALLINHSSFIQDFLEELSLH